MDWVHCSRCAVPLKINSKRPHFLAKCGAIFCDSCCKKNENNQQCHRCKRAGCPFEPLNAISQDVKVFFDEFEKRIDKLKQVYQFQNMHFKNLFTNYYTVFLKYKQLSAASAKMKGEMSAKMTQLEKVNKSLTERLRAYETQSRHSTSFNRYMPPTPSTSSGFRTPRVPYGRDPNLSMGSASSSRFQDNMTNSDYIGSRRSESNRSGGTAEPICRGIASVHFRTGDTPPTPRVSPYPGNSTRRVGSSMLSQLGMSMRRR